MDERPMHFLNMIGLISAADLATMWGYAGPNDAFRTFCARLGITHIPGRPGWYDPRHVRRRLDDIQGLSPVVAAPDAPALSLVDQRKARRGAA